jgi:hypothetical protein
MDKVKCLCDITNGIVMSNRLKIIYLKHLKYCIGIET